MGVSSVKIGCHTYQVREMDECNNDLDGQCSPTAVALRISTGARPLSRQLVTIIHEVLHALDDMAQTGLKERQVAALSEGLAMVLMDNPEILAAVARCRKGSAGG